MGKGGQEGKTKAAWDLQRAYKSKRSSNEEQQMLILYTAIDIELSSFITQYLYRFFLYKKDN